MNKKIAILIFAGFLAAAGGFYVSNGQSALAVSGGSNGGGSDDSYGGGSGGSGGGSGSSSEDGIRREDRQEDRQEDRREDRRQDNQQFGVQAVQVRDETRVRAETFVNASEAKVEREFTTTQTERNAVAQETLDKLKLSRNTISSLLVIEPGQPDDFMAILTGGEEVPAVTTAATGTADLDLQQSDTQLQFKVRVGNIQNVTASHIHRGFRGQNGPVVANLFLGPTTTGRFDGVLAEGVIRAGDLVGPLAGQPFSSLVDMIRRGEAYVNVHTTQNPSGEIRGQVVSEEEEQIRDRLEVRAVVRGGITEVDAEFRFKVATTTRTGIGDGIFARLSALTLNDILNVLEFRTEQQPQAQGDRSGSNRGPRSLEEVRDIVMETQEDFRIKADNDVRITSALIESIEMSTGTPSVPTGMLKINIFGLRFTVNAANARIFVSGINTATLADLNVGDRVSIRGTLDRNTGIIIADTIHDRSLQFRMISSIENEIRRLMTRIGELQRSLRR